MILLYDTKRTNNACNALRECEGPTLLSVRLFAHEDLDFTVAKMEILAKLELVTSIETAKDTIPEVIELSSEAVTVGRSRRLVSVVLDLTPTNTISRRHAEIAYRKSHQGKDTFAVKDLASTNGVFVNDVKIQEHPLEHGDIVQFGGAADIAVGTRFDGAGSHIRYRFSHDVVQRPSSSRKRPPPSGPGAIAVSPPAQPPRQKKMRSTSSPKRTGDNRKAGASVLPNGGKPNAADHMDTQNAVGVLCAIANGPHSLAANGANEGGADTCAARTARKRGSGTPAARSSVPEGLGGGDRAVESEERMPALVLEVLSDAMCGLCSELLLDAGVLPCSHSFCRLCWADHVAKKDTTCPVCMRKFHKSESNPRRCVNLDLLITSLVHKLAGEEARRHWEKRQEHTKQRTSEAHAAAELAAAAAKAAAAKAAEAATEAAAEAAAAAATKQTPLSRTGLEGVEACDTNSPRKSSNLGTAGDESINSGGGAPARAQSVVLAGKGARPKRYCRGGGGTLNGKNTRGSLRGSSGDDVNGGDAPAVVCEGCNETGHEFRECPHRSDGAEDGSEDEEEEDEEEEDEEEDDEDEDSDDV